MNVAARKESPWDIDVGGERGTYVLVRSDGSRSVWGNAWGCKVPDEYRLVWSDQEARVAVYLR